MNGSDTDFYRKAVQPIVCFREGWQLIKQDFWLFFGITVVGLLIAGVFAPVLLGPMWCGIYICMLRRMDGRQVTFRNLFEGFNHFGPSVICTLLVVVPTIVGVLVVFGVYVAANIAILSQRPQGAPPDGAFLVAYFGLMALYAVGIIMVTTAMYAPCIFMYGLIVERQMSGLEAFWTSIKALFGNFWGVLGLLVLYTLLNLGGTMLCIIGLYLVPPLYYAGFAVAYRQVFPRPAIQHHFGDEADDDLDGDPAMDAPMTNGIQSELPQKPASTTDITAE